ncbi:MAG: cytochrome P450 [Acidimicrobiia bacterium]
MNPFDPYSNARQAGPTVQTNIGGEDVLMLLRYQDVKAAARNWSAFTSAAPRGVSIPTQMHIRPVPQFPIETDPDEHGQYRALIEPIFGRAAIERHRSSAQMVAAVAVDGFLADRQLEVVEEYALPLVSRTLARVLGRPQSDAERWLQWAPDVFTDADGNQIRNTSLDAYLGQVADEAIALRGADAFGQLASAMFRGRKLTREEIIGYGYLLFAGGRDTVVGVLSSSIWYLAHNEDDRRRLVAQPDLIPSAVEEFLRLMTPLHFIGRVVTIANVIGSCPVSPGDLIALGFASANRDEDVFEAPNELRIDRSPNRHMAFGHGPHLCLGVHLARMELAVALTELLTRVPDYRVIAPTTPNLFDVGIGVAQNGFSQLTIQAMDVGDRGIQR